MDRSNKNMKYSYSVKWNVRAFDFSSLHPYFWHTSKNTSSFLFFWVFVSWSKGIRQWTINWIKKIIVLLVGVWFESRFITRHYHRCLRWFLLLLCQIFLNGRGHFILVKLLVKSKVPKKLQSCRFFLYKD